MHRIDTATKAADLFGAGKHGYKDGDKANGIPATDLDAATFNALQEEIVGVIEGQGIALVKGNHTQLRQAITQMIQSGQRAVIINNATFAPAVTGTGKAVYWDSANNRFDLALADGSAKQNMVGFADVANGNVYAFGDAVLFAGLTPGGRYYLDSTTAGAITVTAPEAGVLVGIARSATEMFVDIDVKASSNVVDSVARSQIAVVNMRLMANTLVTSGPLVLGRQWELLSDELAAGSTGYTFVTGSPGYYTRTPSGYAQISTAGKTFGGNLTSGAGVAAAFDGNTSQDLSTGSYCTGAASEGYVQVDFGAGNNKTVSQCKFFSSNNYGYSNNAGDYNTNCITLTLYGSADGASWTQLAQITGVNNTTGATQSNTLNVSLPAAYRHYKGAISRTGGGSVWGALAELQLFQTNSATDAILLTPSVSLSSIPPYADLVCGYKDDSGSAVLGIDLVIEFQRDGALWTPATTYSLLTPAAGLDGTFMAIQARANLGAQGAGTSLRSRISILNKDQRFALPVLCSE